MPVLPFLNPVAAKTVKSQMQTKFLGLNNRESCDGSQFTETWNLSSDEYPYLAPRKPRRRIRTLTDATAILGGDRLAWVAGGKLYYDKKEICGVESGRPQLVRMGAYLVVWPDRVIYNTHTGELTRMDASFTQEGVSARPCTLSGAEYEYVSGDTPPANPIEQSYWYNTATGGFYQCLGGEWQGIDTVYTKLEAAGLGKGFADYDVVTISGFSSPELNVEAATVYGHGDDYIVIATGVFRDLDEEQAVTVARTAPEMDYICESGNRLWGCSSAKHEIYGSKLGDPTNWHSYLGISTDSYAATIGSEGDFTGIVTYMGYVHFFKEDRCHRLYGTRPENFQLYELPIRGVKAGCDRSLCVVNGILYYVTRDGVLAFDGASPVDVGDALGDVAITDAVAGAHGKKMYLSALVDGRAALYVMDSSKGLWHREDGLRAAGFATTAEGDFILDNGGIIWQIDGGGSVYEDRTAGDEEEVRWVGITGDQGQDTPNQKWVKRLVYRIKSERGSRLDIDIMYDSDGKWHRALSYEQQGKKSETLQIGTRRCDHYRIKYAGTGRVLILSCARTYDEGSERSCLSSRG